MITRLFKTKSYTILAILVVAVFLFGFATYSSFAQTWREPGTKAPGEDDEAENIPNLVRVEDPNAVCAYTATGLPVAPTKSCSEANPCNDAAQYCKQRQFKEGQLRIGSSTTTDVISDFEVFGDIQIQKALLVRREGSTECDASLAKPGAALCNTADDGNQEEPTFFVPGVAPSFVAIGANDILHQGIFSIRATNNEFPNGAVYSSGAAGYGLFGKSTAGAGFAGIFGQTSNEYVYSVIGKSVNRFNRGVYGDKGVGVAAGYFVGNVVITGGFIQGSGLDLTQVSSLRDNSMSDSVSGIGIGVWASTVVESVSENQEVLIDMHIDPGQQVIRTISVLVAQDTGGIRTFKPIALMPGITATIEGGAGVRVTNSTGTKYVVKIVAMVQTGLNITVYHDEEGHAAQIVRDLELIPFVPGGYYELRADAGGSQEFEWGFSGTPAGKLCPGQSDTGCVTGTNKLSGINTVFYQIPPGGPLPSDKVFITWLGSTGDVSRTITLMPTRIDVTEPVKALYNAGVEGSGRPALSLPVTATNALGQVPVLNYAITDKRPVEDIVGGLYYAPGESMNSFDPKRVVTASVPGYSVEKQFTVYLVPDISIVTKFPLDDAYNTPGSLTDNTLFDKPILVEKTVLGVDNANSVSISANGCTGFPLMTCNSFIEQDPENPSPLYGRRTIIGTWTPDASFAYPGGFTHTVSKDIYTGRIEGSGGGNANSVTITYTIRGFSTTTLNTALPLNNLAFNAAPPVNTEIGKDSSGGVSSLSYTQNPDGSFTVNVVVAPSSTTTYYMRARTLFDKRSMGPEYDASLKRGYRKPDSNPCTGCSGTKPPACCGNVINTQDPNGDIGAF